MKKPIVLTLTLIVLFSVLAGCRASNSTGDEAGNAASSPGIRWDAVPAVFVNDTYFRIFENRQHTVPYLDDTWVYLGDIQSAAPGWESPTQNFQTNNEQMIGAEIYHSSECRIPITNSTWGDPLEAEVIGDSLIVIFEGLRLLYISEETHDEAIKVMDAVERHSLMVDGVMYSLMGSAGGRDFILDDRYVFLGEITSAVPIDEFPTDNLQANRDIVIGAKVYRMPPDENNDLVVFFTQNSRFYYKHLPGTIVNH
jgi:hypothetical protein